MIMINCTDILREVMSYHYSPMDFEEGDIEERIYKYDFYTLKKIPLAEIEKVWSYIDEDEIENNILLTTCPPPIVLGYYEDGSFMYIDGGHRIETARRKKRDLHMGICSYKGGLNRCKIILFTFLGTSLSLNILFKKHNLKKCKNRLMKCCKNVTVTQIILAQLEKCKNLT